MSKVVKKVLKKVNQMLIRTKIVEFLMIWIKTAMRLFSKVMDTEKLNRQQSRFRDKRE